MAVVIVSTVGPKEQRVGQTPRPFLTYSDSFPHPRITFFKRWLYFQQVLESLLGAGNHTIKSNVVTSLRIYYNSSLATFTDA